MSYFTCDGSGSVYVNSGPEHSRDPRDWDVEDCPGCENCADPEPSAEEYAEYERSAFGKWAWR